MPNPGPGGVRTSLSFQAKGAFGSQWSVFSPGQPLKPVSEEPVRVFDFLVGQNANINPRAYEPFGFAALRAFANVELVRLAIETRKDQMERLGWAVKPRDGRRPRADVEQRVRKAEKFFRKPDGATPFGTWLRIALEDLLVLDAPAFEKRRTVGGDLIGLDIVQGDTIKLLVDDTGRRPLAPSPAYQQIIKGRPWADLSTDDLLYVPRNPRPGKLYGYSPVEQIIVTIHKVLRRDAAQLAYFTEGNLPAGLVNAPEGWTPDQLKQYQDWMDGRLSGNTAERSKLLWAPFGSKYQAFKDSPIKDEFDEWLARVVCFAFSLAPTPFIKQLNRSTAQTSDDSGLEEGREPLMLWWKRIADDLIAEDLGCPDLEWAWQPPKEIDPEKQANVHAAYLKVAAMSVDEVRDDLGLDPVAGGDRPLIYTATGAMPLDLIREGAEAEVRPPKPADEAPAGDPVPQPAEA